MKKTQKKVWGILGLFVVVAITIAAASLPSPDASAVSSVTDTITVRVVGAEPNVSITGIESGSEVVKKDQNINVSYENIKNVKVTVEYTDPSGEKHIYTLADEAIDTESGDLSFNLDLSGSGYGYGDYVVHVSGEGSDGVPVEDSVSFSFYPVTGEATKDEGDSNDYTLNLDYTPDDGTTTSAGEVANIVVNVYDENGNLVTPLSPIAVTPPATSVPLPFGDYNLPSGRYKIEIVAYDRDGNQLYAPYITYIEYEAKEAAPIPVPDTGTILKDLNISKVDYLITGIVIFSLAAIAGIMVIVRKNSNKKVTEKSRRRK